MKRFALILAALASPLLAQGTGPTSRVTVLNPVTSVAVSALPPVAVSNFPATQSVSVSGTVPVTGTFWQATQPVSGTVAAAQSGAWNVGITGTPTVSVSNFPATQSVSGTVAVSNFPATQSVTFSGSPSVSVSNFPASQAVTDSGGSLTVDTGTPGTFTIGNAAFGISGSLPTGSNTIGNVGINGTVPVSGTFWQATQPVSGTVSVSNFPATQPVSIASNLIVTEAPSASASVALTPVDVLGAAALVVATGARNFYSASMLAAGSVTFFIVADLAAIPASGTTLTAANLIHCIRVDSNGNGSVGTDLPDRVANGVVLLASTACNIYTPVPNAPVYMRGRAM